MRSGSTGNRRYRGRNGGNSGGQRRGGGNGGSNKNQVFDSNGPDVRIRGTAKQISEKYQALAKDCLASGNLVQAEGYLQHAEHYVRVLNAHAQKREQSRQESQKKEASSHDASGADLSLPASVLGEPSNSEPEEKVSETA